MNNINAGVISVGLSCVWRHATMNDVNYLVLAAQTIASGYLAETLQIDHIQSGNVIPSALQMIAPIALFPETESFHLATRITEWRVRIWSTTEV